MARITTKNGKMGPALDVTPDGFVLRERAPGVSVAQIRAATAGKLVVHGDDGDVPEMRGV